MGLYCPQHKKSRRSNSFYQLNHQIFVFADGEGGLQTTDGDDFLGFVVVEAAVTGHLDVDEHVGVSELGHEDGVLTDHQRTGARENGVVVEVEVVGNQFVENLGLQRLVSLATFEQALLQFPLGFVIVAADVDANEDVA